MKSGKINILIGGPAGAGIEKSGKLLTLSFVRGGYRVFANVEHMSQIRGGNNFLRIRVDEKFQQCHEENTDILIALDKQTIAEHMGEMNEGGAIIYDGEEMKPEKNVLMVNVPLKSLAISELGNPVMANVIGLGVLFGLIDYDISGLKEVLGKVFGNKSVEVRAANEKAAQMGFDIAKEKWADKFEIKIKKGAGKNEMFLMGNDAVSLGALKAGVKFVGEYPMTPSSSILHFMAQWSEKYGVVVKHVEDEIAAANSIIGAGFAGVRALAATSGGGFALMTEAVGLASMNEVPIVIVNVMRPGPATGLPTRTAAGDLRQVIHSGQDDPVKIVLCPGDIFECFEMGFEAFNLAEKYQLPVIITYDKNLGEGYFTVPAFDDSKMVVDRGSLLTQEELEKMPEYKRYLRAANGVSPRSIPGMKGGTHRATSDEHNEFGEICETAENRKLMVEKRMKKLEAALNDMPKPLLIGEKNAEITLVTWNSSKLACLETMEILGKDKINILQIRCAYPFHKKEVSEILKKAKRLVAVEQNYTAQMAGLVAENTGILIEEKILRYDGRPMTAQNIIDGLKL
ncbi:MAG: 2-oxoacid:acceptor oxidoreductase subunit alpha [Candidatus Gracilibacteria bacterium]